MSPKEKFEFTFLSEKPLEANSKNALAFGHGEIVKTLSEIIKNSPEAFTIGLYGDWGSGKSTIACSLKETLKKDDVPLIIFDVWKHEGDALRRTFLNTLVNQLKDDYDKDVFKKDYELHERTNASKTINDEFHTISWKKVQPHLLVLLVFTAVFFIPFFLFYLIADVAFGLMDIGTNIGGLVTGAFSLLSFSLFFKYINQFIEVKKVTTNVEKFKDPQEFEDEFKRILKEGLLKKKLVIVFDNLDRVSGEKALEIMSTIKTFLDPIDKKVKDKDVIFIIPCDEKAIKRHIKKVLNFTDTDEEYERYASEYLRKFFNTIIWIPEFYTNELEKLALENLKATKIPDLVNDEIAALIVLVFDKNPRQIIQYVNILVSNYLLIRERNIQGFDLKANIAQYAKYLIMVQRFPEIMELLREKMIYDLEDPDAFVGIDVETYKNLLDFRSFLELTSHISIRSLDVFFKLRKSEFEAQFDNSEKLLRLIDSQVKNVVMWKDHDPNKLNLTKLDGTIDMKYIEDFNINDRLPALNSIVKQKITKTRNPVLVAKFIDGLFYFTYYYKIQLSDDTYNSIIAQLGKSTSHFFMISPQKLLGEGYQKISNETIKEKLLTLARKQWIADFIKNITNNSPNELFLKDYQEAILKLLIEHIDLFKNTNLDSVKNVISSRFQNRVELFETISNDKNLRSLLASPQYLTNAIQVLALVLLETTDAEQYRNNVARVSKAASLYHERFFNPDTIRVILGFLNTNINQIKLFSETSTEVSPYAESLFLLFKKTISLAPEVSQTPMTTLINSVLSVFQIENFKLAEYLFPFVYYYHRIELKTPFNVTVPNALAQFLRSETNVKKQVEIISKVVPMSEFLEDEIFYQTLQSRIISDENFLAAYFEYLNENQQSETLTAWSQRNLGMLDAFLKTINYAVPDADAFAAHLLTQIRVNNDLEKIALTYEILSNLNVSKDFSYETYSNLVIDLITTTDVLKQQLGIKEYNKNKSRIDAEKLQSKVKSVLQNSFLPNIASYNQNIKNVFSIDFSDKKKVVNEIYEHEEKLKNRIVQQIAATGDLELFNIFYKQLNHISFCKTLLTQFGAVILNDKSKLESYKPMLELMDKKHHTYLKDEMLVFVENYKLHLTTPVDEFIARSERN